MRFGYEQPGLHVMLESLFGCVAILAALFLFRRLTVVPQLDLLLLGTALLLLGVGNLALTALPDALSPDGTHTVASWGAVLCRLVGSLILLAAALLPQRPVRRLRRAVILSAASVGVLVGAAAAAVLLSRSTLPTPISFESATPEHLDINGHYLAYSGQLIALLAFVAAAVVFTRRAAREGDVFLGRLALAMTFGAVAQLYYSVNPSLYSPLFYTGDAFRFLAYLTVLVAAFSEIGRYWSRLADSAAAEERRRIARDLHDGVAQEFAFILREGRRMGLSDELVHAAERGLTECRRGLLALDPATSESLDQVLLQAVEDVAARDGMRVELELDTPMEVPWKVSEAFARIAREAVTNASRHGQAQRVRIAVSNGNGIALVVHDDGIGFDPVRCADKGYGLRTMRERAESLGGGMSIRSLPGRGTRVEVVLP